MEKYDAEIIALGERIMKYCPDQNICLEAMARLAFQDVEMERKNIGCSIYETLPPKALCRENQIWWGLEEEEKASFIRTGIATGDSRALCERMRDKWLENPVFDAYRSEGAFQEIVSQLTAGIR